MDDFFDYWLSVCSSPPCDCDTTLSSTTGSDTTNPTNTNHNNIEAIKITPTSSRIYHQQQKHRHPFVSSPFDIANSRSTIVDYVGHNCCYDNSDAKNNNNNQYPPINVSSSSSSHLYPKEIHQPITIMDPSSLSFSIADTTTVTTSEITASQPLLPQHVDYVHQDKAQEDKEHDKNNSIASTTSDTTYLVITDDDDDDNAKEPNRESSLEVKVKGQQQLDDQIEKDETRNEQRQAPPPPPPPPEKKNEEDVVDEQIATMATTTMNQVEGSNRDTKTHIKSSSLPSSIMMKREHVTSKEDVSSTEVTDGTVTTTQSSSSNAHGGSGNVSGSNIGRTESHRIYWQQWIRLSPQTHEQRQQQKQGQSNNNKNNDNKAAMQPELITSSAAIRLSKSAKAIDVTNLLRKTVLHLSSSLSSSNHEAKTQQDVNGDNTSDPDRLVLVGTLYSLPPDYIQFDPALFITKETATSINTVNESSLTLPTDYHTVATTTSAALGGASGIGTDGDNVVYDVGVDDVSSGQYQQHGMAPCHVVKTLRPYDKPLAIHDRMNKYMNRLIEQSQQLRQQQLRQPSQNDDDNGHQNSNVTTRHRTIISPKIQWYYIPSMKEQIINDDNQVSRSNTKQQTASSTNRNRYTTNNNVNTNVSSVQSFIPNCVELDGYCSPMHDDDDDDDDDDDYDHSQEEEDTEDGDDDDDDDENCRVIDHICFEANHPQNHHQFHQESRTLAPTDCPDNPIDGSMDGLRHKMIPAVDHIEATLFSKFLWLSMGTSSSIDEPSENAALTTTTDQMSPVVSRDDLDNRRRHERLLRRYYRIYKRRSRAIHEYVNSDRISLIMQTDIVVTNGTTTRSPTSFLPFSGFLLKRDSRDPNVWRRVYCTLTNNDLWYHSRMYHHRNTSHNNGNAIKSNRTFSRYTKHGSIRLTRALVLEPSINYLPLYCVPYAFEIITKNGVCHGFRAVNEEYQMIWIRLISERIVQSFENHYFYDADLLVHDEMYARNNRMDHSTIEPLWNHMIDVITSTTATSSSITIGATGHDINRNNSRGLSLLLSSTIPSTIGYSTLIGVVLRWSIQVAEYRELCRYIQSILPAKNPIVVINHHHDPSTNATPKASRSASVSSSAVTLPSSKVDDAKTTTQSHQTSGSTVTTSSRLSLSFFGRNRSSPKNASATTSTTDDPKAKAHDTRASNIPTGPTMQAMASVEPMDPMTKDMIRMAWDTATSLLARATHVAYTLQQQEQNHRDSHHTESVPNHPTPSSLSLFGSNHSHVETLCRHIDYVITGRFRPLGRGTNSNSSGSSHHNASNQTDQHHQDVPPPMDLFDQLLGELQKLASRADLVSVIR